MPDIMAIVSKAVFERDARIDGALLAPGDVWPVDRYNSANKALQTLADGGRIFLVTVRPPNEQLWFVGVVERPRFDGTAWVARTPNTLPVTNITPLRKTIVFESGKGITQDKGTLGMSLQTPRALAATDVEQILGTVAVGGTSPAKAATLPAAVPAHRSERPAPARVIGGKYEVLRELGKGGMGVVHEARHTGTGRRVAVKEILSTELGADSKIVQRFHREARATGAIETQHVTPVLDTGTDPATNNPYLVMELLDGTDLQTRLEETGALSQDLALRIAAQAAVGLARAHAAGVIHRDIKPANLFLAKRDDEVIVKLLDFGVARVKEELQGGSEGIHRALTSTGVMLGTPLYMSPEQVMGQKDLDHRSDLWSLGVVLYELLAGVTPYDEIETMGALLVSICSRPARPLRELSPHVSPSVETIVRRTLEIDPARRYATADELLADLRRELPHGTRLDESMLAPP